MKYLSLQYDNNLKKKSLEDNVYYTLIDIFNNASTSDLILRVYDYNNFLKEKSGYTRILYDKEYVAVLINMLKHINESSFEFIVEDGYYMRLDDWLLQFEDLKCVLVERYRQLNMT
jgi:hypothetical protein